jgi:hypothetical protein
MSKENDNSWRNLCLDAVGETDDALKATRIRVARIAVMQQIRSTPVGTDERRALMRVQSGLKILQAELA